MDDISIWNSNTNLYLPCLLNIWIKSLSYNHLIYLGLDIHSSILSPAPEIASIVFSHWLQYVSSLITLFLDLWCDAVLWISSTYIL